MAMVVVVPEIESIMKRFLKRKITDRNTVLITAIVASVSIALGLITAYVHVVSQTVAVLLFVVSAFFSCATWISHVLYERASLGDIEHGLAKQDRLIRERVALLEDKLDKNLDHVSDKLGEYSEYQVKEQQTQALNQYLSLQDFKLSMLEGSTGHYDE